MSATQSFSFSPNNFNLLTDSQVLLKFTSVKRNLDLLLSSALLLGGTAVGF